jgi:hypothetical protein
MRGPGSSRTKKQRLGLASDYQRCRLTNKFAKRGGYASEVANLWFLRKFADSSNGADTIEKVVRLAKHMATSPTGEFLSNISEPA